MSLATRCTECHTTFKVVQDQLKVSRGWVRCGHCQQVFNALENMFDIEEPNTPPAGAPPASHQAATETPIAVVQQQATADSIELDFPDTPSDQVIAEPATPAPPVSEPTPAATEAPSSTDSGPHTSPEPLRWSNLIAEPSATTAPALERSLPPPSQRSGRSGTRGRLPPPAEPTFMKEAERQAIWRHPLIQGVLWFLLLVFLLLLAGQTLLHWRNDVAAQFPAAKPLLAQLCAPLGCAVNAPKNLSHLQVESVTVVKVASRGPSAYQLTVLVRNSGDSDVQWPLLDLTLTDSNGQTLTRRDISVQAAAQVPADDNHGKPASQFWPVPAAVEPGLIALQWQLQAPDMQLAGYTAELFYP